MNTVNFEDGELNKLLELIRNCGYDISITINDPVDEDRCELCTGEIYLFTEAKGKKCPPLKDLS